MNGMKLLIGYDGSECAEAALRDLQRAGLPSEVEARVLSVADIPPLPNGRPIDPNVPDWLAQSIQEARAEQASAVQKMRAEAEWAVNQLRAHFPTWTVSAEAVADSPAWAIVKYADEWKPDLIVVGSHGRSTLGRVVMGSVSQRVATHARTIVRVARAGTAAEHQPVRIVVGVDGSVYAEAAVRIIAARHWPLGSVVRLVAAIDPFMSTAVGTLDKRVMQWVAEGDSTEMWVRKMVEASANEIHATGLDTEAVVKSGDPKHVLIHEAETWGADCIFVGARGLNAFERFVLGSVSTAVAARAHCSVEVVHVAQSV